jgi:hypothetical protein
MDKAVLTRIANAVLSLLLLATFMWGGCVSCEQYFMFPGKQRACCNKSGRCQRPGKPSRKPETVNCTRLPFQRGETVRAVPIAAILPAFPGVQIAQPLPFPASLRLAFELLIDPSPPDFQALHATFLI